MAVSGSTQALIAAFMFGILVNAASAAIVLFTKGYGSAVFRNGLRLALVIFLASSALWAQMAFISTAIDTTSSSACQVTVTFSTIFDQFARVAIEQYMVFMAQQEETKPLRFLPQLLVLARFIVGIVFIALTRSEFQPTCVPTTSQVPVAVTVIAMDAIILALLAVQFLSGGQGKSAQEDSGRTERVKSFIGLIVGVAIWTGTSVTLFLGLSTIDLFFRTALPAIGLLLLIVITTLLSGSLTLSLSPASGLPIAGGSDGTRDISSPDTYYYPPSSYEDVKFNESVPTVGTRNVANNRRIIPRPTKGGSGAAGKLAISYPIVTDTDQMDNPFSRIPTVDLSIAVENDRRRRAADPQSSSYLVANTAAPLPPSFPAADKEVAPVDLSRTDSGKSAQISEMLSVQGNALSSSAQLSPGADALRRRSPRQTQPSSMSKTFEAVQPGEPIRIPIPQPPRTASEPSSELSEQSQETIKTPLKRRPTNGLPSNPRAPATRDLATHARSKTEQTVMLMNDIAYNDPGAAIGALSRANTLPLDLSVVNRPRPIPRKSDKEDRQVFPAEISPPHPHRRAKSSGSVLSKRSILKSRPGSPTELPPLPPPPKSAGATSRPQPNNTKSMTFDEKMDLFYAPPLSAITGVPGEEKQSPEVDSTQRQSIATSPSSIRTADVLEVSGETRKPAPEDDTVEPLQPSVPTNSRWSDDPTQVDVTRRSSPVVPHRQSNMSTVRDDDAMTNWGSVHSPVAAVHVRQARLNARSTYIQKDLRQAEEASRNVPSFNDQSQSGEVVTVMLDTSSTPENRQLPHLERGNSVARALAPTRRSSPRQFHRRVGDECPTFSGREKAHSRKMPPPAPLLLSMNGGKKAVAVQPKKPSPLESPGAVYQLIQDQLKKLEALNEEDFENEGDRMELLEDLEREMAGQQNKWQSLHMTIHRDSVSTVQTSSPSKGSRPPSMVAPLSLEQSQQRFISPGKASSRQSNRLSGNRTRSREDVLELIMEDSNSDVLLIPKPSPGSPSSPETDESDAEVENEEILRDSSMTSCFLWQPKPFATTPSTSGLWKESTGLRGVEASCELPGLNLRPKIRTVLEPLTTESSRMWQREMWTSELNETSGLWQKRIPIQRQQTPKVAKRPLTMRPPRKNKRLTQLPDILESPEPLDRRGTLGIFRFPTGEKSENATVQYRPSQSFMPMPGTMTTGVPIFNAILQARAQQIQAEEATSYLDDFDEFDEESGDNFDDCSDCEDGGDEFDETTLWEIADLLKPEDGPSGDSLLAAAFSPSERVDSSVLEAPVYDDHSDEESDEGSVVDFEMIPKSTTPAHNSPAVLFEPAPVQPLLWSHETCTENTYLFGLPQPDTEVWNAYNAETGEESRSRSHTKEALPILPIHSTSLWVVSVKESSVEYSTGLWAKLSTKTSVDMKAPVQVSDKISLLWDKPSMAPKSPLNGLFSTTARRTNYRTTSAEPAALHVSKAPRVTREPLPQLTTTSLWSTSKSGAIASNLPRQQQYRADSPVKQAHKPRSVTSGLLWARPMAVSKEVSEGLFDVRSKRVDYRRTSQLPAALSMTRKPSIRREPMVKLVSRELWSSQALAKLTPTSGKPSLWIKSVTIRPVTSGLFKVDPERRVYRTTTAEPAALQMDRKPRKSQGSLQELESSNLWVSSQGSIELDWLTISSTRPRSPSIASVSTDSTASSPVSDVFSVKTNVTRASSVAESTKKGKAFLGGWFGKNKKEKRISDVPEVPELPSGFMNKNLDFVALEKPARVPLRKLYHPGTVYPADWNAAFCEAMAASYPVKRTAPTKRTIPRVPPAEWDAQLYQAIQASGVQRQLTRVVASPQEWAAALNTAIAASYRPSKSAGKDTNTSLWAKPAALSTQAPKGLWAATSANVTALDATTLPKLSIDETRPQRSRASSESTRRGGTVEVSSELHAQRLWRRRDHSPSRRGFRAHARDWLDDTTKRRFSRLELRY